jgi:SLT domain-containing protein
MAVGGKVPGWHNTGDNVPAMSPSGPLMLQGGEAIVPKHLASNPKFTSFAKDHGIPGFASGGLVGTDKLVNMTNNWPDYKAKVANAGIDHAGEAMKANTNAAYNALLHAFSGSGGSASGQAILMDAERYKGHKYVWGGASNPAQGWDCSSFAGYVLGHDMHMPLPGGAKWNPGAHGPVASQYTNTPGFRMVSHNPKDIQAGDLLVEGSGGHVGFGVGPNRMFSAYGTAVGTIFSDAANMTNILRSGGGAHGGGMKGLTSKNPLINAMTKDIDKVYDASAVIQALFPTLGGAYSGNPSGANPNYRASAGVAQWGGDVLKALSMLHLPASLENQILYQISTESGGNPNAINNWDVNAKHGDPTRGLLQPTGSTFQAYHVPGTSTNMFDGLANIAASVNYAEHRYGPSLMSGKTGLGSGHGYEMGGMIPGFAAGGRIKSNPAQTQLTKLHHQHDRYAADYHRHMAAAQHDKSKHSKAYQLAQAAKYARLISQVDTQLSFDKSAKLKMPRPTNGDMKLAERLASPPWVNRLTSGAGSVTPLGWGMQPVLGDMMIARAMGTPQWLGKSTIDPQATSVMANWVAAMQTIGGFLGANPNVAKLAGKATGVHGKTTGGKSFKLGGTLGEDAVGYGISSGAPYTFHQGDRMVGPNQTPGQINQSGLSHEDRQILLKLLQEAKRSNQIASQQPREYAKALNSNVSRKVGR